MLDSENVVPLKPTASVNPSSGRVHFGGISSSNFGVEMFTADVAPRTFIPPKESLASSSRPAMIADGRDDLTDTTMTISREELDAKLAANQFRLENIELRIDKKIESATQRIEHKADLAAAAQREANVRLETALSHTATSRGMVAAVASGALGVFVAVLTTLSFATNRYDAGISGAFASSGEIEALKQRQSETERTVAAIEMSANQHFSSLSEKMDKLLQVNPRQ